MSITSSPTETIIKSNASNILNIFSYTIARFELRANLDSLLAFKNGFLIHLKILFAIKCFCGKLKINF